MVNRLKQFIDSQNISVRSFEISIKASDGVISRAIRNNTDIQSKWLTEITFNYKELNLEWLITGKGDMLKSSSKNELPLFYDAPTIPSTPSVDNTTLLRELINEKDEHIERLQREIGRLEIRLENSKEKEIDSVIKENDSSIKISGLESTNKNLQDKIDFLKTMVYKVDSKD